jgi:hypothetical protein
MQELQQITHADRPVTGTESRDNINSFFAKRLDAQAAAEGKENVPVNVDSVEEHRPDTVVVEIQGLVEQQRVSSTLSTNFRCRLENIIRGSLSSVTRNHSQRQSPQRSSPSPQNSQGQSPVVTPQPRNSVERQSPVPAPQLRNNADLQNLTQRRSNSFASTNSTVSSKCTLQVNKHVTYKGNYINTINKHVKHKGNYINTINKHVKHKDNYINTINKHVKHKDNYINTINKHVKLKDNYINTINKHVKHKDNYINTINKHVKHKDNYINTIIAVINVIN